uniref:Uncharacterized protein n=1 Tax=Salarias fasciatus TaxID=181472 RepID=A0A672JRZ4_SALFA
ERHASPTLKTPATLRGMKRSPTMASPMKTCSGRPSGDCRLLRIYCCFLSPLNFHSLVYLP